MAVVDISTEKQGFVGDDSTTRQSQFYQAILLGTALLAVLASLVLLLWGIDRSFNILDEGFAVLSATAPKSYPFYSSFHYFLGKCPVLYINQLCTLRLLHIISCIVGTVVLTAGVQRWMKVYCQFIDFDRIVWGSVYSFSLIGSFVVYSVHPQVLTYNGLITLFVFIAVGLLFLALCEIESKARSVVLSGGVGFFMALAFFCKFSSTLLVLGIMVAFCVIGHRKRLSVILLYSIAGGVLGVFSFFGFFQNSRDWFWTQLNTINAVSQGAHGPIAVFSNTFLSLLSHKWEGALCIAIIVGAFGAVKFNLFVGYSDEQLLRGVSIISLILLLSFIALSTTQYGLLHRSILYFGIVPPILLLIARLIPPAYGEHANEAMHFGGLVFFLFVLPLVNSVGTDTPLLWHAFTSFGAWYLSLALLYFAVGRIYKSTAFPVFSLCIIICISMFQFIRGFVWGPPHTKSLIEQTIKANQEPLTGLWLEPELYSYINDTERILLKAGYRKGDSILALNDGPGLIYAIGGRSPGAAWYFGDPRGVSHNEYQLGLIEPPKERFFVIVTNSENESLPPSNILRLLSVKGIDLSKDYKIVGESKRPLLYCSRGRISYIYAKKEP